MFLVPFQSIFLDFYWPTIFALTDVLFSHLVSEIHDFNPTDDPRVVPMSLLLAYFVE